MERAVYRAILEKVSLPLSAWPHVHALAQLFGVSFDTVFSIYSFEVQTRVLRTNHVVKAAMGKHAQRYLAGKHRNQALTARDHIQCCRQGGGEQQAGSCWPPLGTRRLPPPPGGCRPALKPRPPCLQEWTPCSWHSSSTFRPACCCAAC